MARSGEGRWLEPFRKLTPATTRAAVGLQLSGHGQVTSPDDLQTCRFKARKTRKSGVKGDGQIPTRNWRFHRYPLNGKRRSLRDVAGEVAAAGHMTSPGKPHAAAAVEKMVE